MQPPGGFAFRTFGSACDEVLDRNGLAAPTQSENGQNRFRKPIAAEVRLR